MRWDIRHPEKRFGDKFILVAGHTVPLIYSMLAAYNTALQAQIRADRRREVRRCRTPSTSS